MIGKYIIVFKDFTKFISVVTKEYILFVLLMSTFYFITDERL